MEINTGDKKLKLWILKEWDQLRARYALMIG
jgi:hypothetical protein